MASRSAGGGCRCLGEGTEEVLGCKEGGMGSGVGVGGRKRSTERVGDRVVILRWVEERGGWGWLEEGGWGKGGVGSRMGGGRGKPRPSGMGSAY